MFQRFAAQDGVGNPKSSKSLALGGYFRLHFVLFCAFKSEMYTFHGPWFASCLKISFILQHKTLFIGGSRGACPAPARPSLRVQILSFRNHLGSSRPPTRFTPPPAGNPGSATAIVLGVEDKHLLTHRCLRAARNRKV